MNDTITKFGFPQSLIAEYEHWVVLLRPKQPTLGCLVLANKSEATAAGQLSSDEFAELAAVSADIELALKGTFSADKFNYLMLMMVDPQVHYHVIPRYESAREFSGNECIDSGWPALPELGSSIGFDAAAMKLLQQQLIDHWPSS